MSGKMSKAMVMHQISRAGRGVKRLAFKQVSAKMRGKVRIE
jgi:hypothetical protein